jgi:hypothetical protein
VATGTSSVPSADCGFVYVATMLDRYVEEAFLSAETAKQRCPDVPITLFTDRPHLELCKMPCFDEVRSVTPVTGINSQWAVGQLYRLRSLSQTPYQRTLHLDTDTRVLTDDVPELFERLNDVDVAMIETLLDDSYSRVHYGKRMFNAGFVLYRHNQKVWEWLSAWADLSERNFRLAGQGDLTDVPSLQHVADQEVRRNLLNMDQTSLVEILSPENNPFDLKLEILDYCWNHRGSFDPAFNQEPVKILHSYALRFLTHADILAVAFACKKSGRLAELSRLHAYLASKYAKFPQADSPVSSPLEKNALVRD